MRAIELAGQRVRFACSRGHRYPLGGGVYVNHGFQDAVSLELARRIADGLPQHPEWIDLGRSNLERWARLNSQAPSLLCCYEEWRELLARPIVEICAALTAETDEGQRVRQNSPFAGVIPPSEVWNIKARLRHATPAA